MSEAEFQINQNFPFLSSGGRINHENRPEYESSAHDDYHWRLAKVVNGNTVRVKGEILKVAICSEDERFCVVDNFLAKPEEWVSGGGGGGSIRRDVIEFISNPWQIKKGKNEISAN